MPEWAICERKRWPHSCAANFADALIAETTCLAGASETVTFDHNTAKEAGMRLLK